MRLTVFVLCAALLAPAEGAVYKWVDEEGNVIYSDRPQPGAEEVKVPDVQTYEAPNLPKIEPAPEAPEFPGYDEFRVVEPRDDETFRDNGGFVQVRLVLSPGLQPGHTINISMDGQDLGGNGRSTSLTLRNVDRGTHTIAAAVVDDEGKVVAQTDPVTFHMHRTSRLIP